jgi:DNA-binding transcriptional LysR family regulator
LIDIRLLTFITVAKTKSYTKSAEILNITQPAVSQHIRFLEEEYGVHLVKRRGRGFDLTEEGLILFEYAEEIEVLYRALEMKLKNKSGIIKKYNVGASMTIGGYVLPYILAKYKKIYQNINILLQVNNTEEILEKLINGKLDFALIEGPFDRSKFKFKKFKDDELVLAVSTENNFAKETEVSMGDILSGNLILREEGSGTRKIFENKIIELGYTLNGYMEIGSISAIKSLIELNLGYSVISRETIKKELNQGNIKAVVIKDVHIFREFNFVYLKEDELINSFIEFCHKNGDF